MSCHPAAAPNSIQSCLSSVQNKLKLNPVKTEFLLIENEQQWSRYLSMFPIEVLGVKTYPAKSARNVGVTFDKNFNFRSQISVICSPCIYHIWDLLCILCHVDLDSVWCLAILITVIQFCLGLQILTSPNSNVFWTVWLMWSQCHHPLPAVSHCCIPFIGYQQNIESIQDLFGDLHGSSWRTTC